MPDNFVKPFVKWVGGKRQLLPEIKDRMPEISNDNTYYEPFIGGGAVFFSLQPAKAVINDFNSELINTYRVIKNDVESLIKDLHSHKNEEEYFYSIRALDRQQDFLTLSDIKRASRFIYLNKTCFSGLYRVNSKGFFNASFARYKSPDYINKHVLREVSRYLNDNDIKIIQGDFEQSVKNAETGDFVYFDPPYQPLSPSSNFTSYTASGFDESQQIRLKELCDNLHERGVKFMLSNSSVPFITDLYKEYNIDIINAKRSINQKGKKQGIVEEVLITNY